MYRVWLALDYALPNLYPPQLLTRVSTLTEARMVMNRTAHELQRDRHYYILDQGRDDYLNFGKRLSDDSIQYLGCVFYDEENACDAEEDGPSESEDPGERLSPALFSMSRGADESGVSGTGHVLDGVIWPNGKVTVCWKSVPHSSIAVYDSWNDFHSIHIASHPDNGTKIYFV